MIKYDFQTFVKKWQIEDTYKSKRKIIESSLARDIDMTGWYNLDVMGDKKNLDAIISTSEYIKKHCDVFIVIGIGGSYLGSKAVIDCFAPYFKKRRPEIIYLGTSLSSNYMKEFIEYIKNKDVIVNIISKSGSTMETIIAFECILEQLKTKYSDEELKDRIIATTDPDGGSLKSLADRNGYKTFPIPHNVGGRYSVLTACGLLPIAVFGIDIYKLIEGAKRCDINEVFNYAILRDILYKDGKMVESFTAYEPKLFNFLEWLKQLFAETQGKNKKGILPVSMINTRDLHSLGQFYQDGTDIIFETVLNIRSNTYLMIDKYNKDLDEINNIVVSKVAQSHYENTTYSSIIELDELNEENIGELIYFFEVAAAVGGYLLGINPFNQPGVNRYKELVNEELER